MKRIRTRRRPAAVPAALLLLAASTYAFAETKVTQSPAGPNEQEVSLAVDPNNTTRQVTAYIDRPSPPGMILSPSIGVSFTTNAGATWADRQIRFGCDGIDDDGDNLTDEEQCNGLDDDGDGAAFPMQCDGFDNDGDLRIDEEFCNGIDDDGDFMVDEDVCCIDEDLCCSLEHIDPSVAADLSGNFFTSFVAYEPSAVSPSCNFRGSSYVVAARSNDGGSSWTVLPPVEQSVHTPGGPHTPFLDKAWIAVDNDPPSAFSGNAYVAWQRDSTNCLDSDVYVAALSSGAGAWSAPVQVNDPGGPTSCNDAPYPVVGIGGQVWTIWRHNTGVCGGLGQFFLDSSMDGGATWGPDMPGPNFVNIPNPMSNHTWPTPNFPFLAVDPTNPIFLYVAYAEDPPGSDEADIMLVMSGDGGMTWSPPSRVNDDVTIRPQFFPLVRAKQNSNGWTLLDVIWQDERNTAGCNGVDDDGDGAPFPNQCNGFDDDGDTLVDEEFCNGIDDDGDFLTDEDVCCIDEELLNGLDDDGDLQVDEDVCDRFIDVYWARSVDTPGMMPTFSPNVRVTTISSRYPTNAPSFFGDYIDMSAGPGSLDYVVWTDTRNGDNDIFWEMLPDIDSDGDGALDFPDCAPADATTFDRPGEVVDVEVDKSGGNAEISWTSQDPTAGSSTRYDIVTGTLSQLTSDDDYRSSSCLVNNHGDTPYTDGRADPSAGDGYYYLVRAENPCRTDDYGDSGETPDPRDGLTDGNASLPDPDPCPI